MKAFDRREQIIQSLHREKKVLVSQLAIKFNVTEETIRRDLEKLEKEGIVTRNYGGAVLNVKIYEDLPYKTRNTHNIEEKIKMGKILLPLIQNGDTIMADPSSTVFEALKIIHNERDNLTIITNSSSIFPEFNDSDHTIISTGGILSKTAKSLNGNITRQTIQNYNVDVALISCKGISMKNGITDVNEYASEIKSIMKKQATKTILLVDSSKFDKVGFVHMFQFGEIDYLLTDKKPSEDWITFLENKHVNLIYNEE